MQCKEYDYVVTYGRNMHSHTYKNEKEKKHKEEKTFSAGQLYQLALTLLPGGKRGRARLYQLLFRTGTNMRTLVPVRVAGTNDCHVSAGHLVPATGTGTKPSCDRH